MSSKIIGPDGREMKSDGGLGQEAMPPKMYELKTCGIKLKTSQTPKEALDQSLMQVRETFASALMAQMVRSGSSKEDAYIKASASVQSILNPFQNEPAARAVFLALAEEVEQMNSTLENLDKRISELESK
jgi:hypothetical protein